jgi:hypothetical protein
MASLEEGRVVIVVPLKPGARDSVRMLLEEGPPFDPENVGLQRHEVFLTDHEAVFIFEAPDKSVLDRLARSPKLRWAAAAWRDFLAGPMRLAEVAYSWNRTTGSNKDDPRRG